MLGLTYDMAAELGPHNIYVNAIMPGPIRTPFFDEIVESKTAEETEAFFAMIGEQAPLGRMGEPDEIAEAACSSSPRTCRRTSPARSCP